ncbi:MAG: hypothetical protein ACTS3R_11000 [Inquilinaceae bacterium]
MNRTPTGLSRRAALRLEFGVIGLGMVALAMIFQPFAIVVFSAGCGLVVLAALANNLLPFAEPGVAIRSVVFAALVVAVIFCSALLIAISAAHLYGLVFLTPPAAGVSLRPPAPPFWEHPLVWSLAAADAVLVLILVLVVRRR